MANVLDLADLESALGAAPSGSQAEPSEDQRRALKDASRAARKADRPALVAKAIAAVDGGDNLEGARLALRAVKQYPDCLQAYVAAAVALDRLGFLAEALAFYEQALARSPNDPTICALLGAAALRYRQPQLAEQFFRLALQLEPGAVGHLNNLAGVLRDLGRFEDAIELLRQRLTLAPEEAALWNTLGTIVQEQGDAETALTFIAEAARLDPKLASAHHNSALALNDLGRYAEAAAALDRAIALATSDTDRAEMRGARGYAHLGAGNFAKGWADYEARFDPLTREPAYIRAAASRWDVSTSLAGKHLLVIGEQGLGDEVVFMNALADATAAASTLTIACEPRLIPVVARSFPNARAVPHLTQHANGRLYRAVAEEYWKGIDVWAPLGDLPKAFRLSLADFPSARGYLRADPARVAAFKGQLAPGMNIGIAWKSLVMTGKRARSFAPFAAWAPLLKSGANFYPLQYGDIAAEEKYAAESLGAPLRRFAELDIKNDLEGVAAAGCALDLVIGPPNASTNLAAACGAETWFITRYATWPMFGTESMPWYPQSRVFRAGEDGSWRTIFEAMKAALGARALAA